MKACWVTVGKLLSLSQLMLIHKAVMMAEGRREDQYILP